MICDNLSEEEVYQAFLLYASLHGLSTDAELTRKRINAYVVDNEPDEVVDDALLAYLEDRIIAPPDIVLERWGASRCFELDRSNAESLRHQTCENWFENGCRFDGTLKLPRLVHFWTDFQLEFAPSNSDAASEEKSEADRLDRLQRKLVEGIRLSFDFGKEQSVLVSHRELGQIGRLSHLLARELHSEAMRERLYLVLTDQRPSAKAGYCKLLVSTGAAGVSVPELVGYSAEAFHAVRKKC